MTDFAVYAGLFASAFLAATIFPAQSEAGLAYLVAMGENPVWFWFGQRWERGVLLSIGTSAASWAGFPTGGGFRPTRLASRRPHHGIKIRLLEFAGELDANYWGSNHAGCRTHPTLVVCIDCWLGQNGALPRGDADTWQFV